MLPESDPASIPQIGFDDGFVRFVGDAVVVEVVPAGGAAALAGVGPVGPFVQVGLIHLQIAVAVAGAADIAGQQGGQLVAQALVDGLLLGGKAVVGQQVLVGAVELELRRVDALVYLIELFGIDQDRKSTRLSSHVRISYAVFCLKKKKNTSSTVVSAR